MSNVRKPHYSIGSGCVWFTVGSWTGRFRFRRGATTWPTHKWFHWGLLRLSCPHSDADSVCKRAGNHYRTYLKIVVSTDVSLRDKTQGHDAFVILLRCLRVDEFSLPVAGNWVCLSRPNHHRATASHQIGTKRQRWTARYRLPDPTQVSARADWILFPTVVVN